MEKVLVLFSALKWRVAIAAKGRALMAKPARVWPLADRPTPEPKMVGFCDLVGISISPLSKKRAVKKPYDIQNL